MINNIYNNITHKNNGDHIISNSFLNNGFNNIINYDSRFVSLKQSSINSKKIYSTVSSEITTPSITNLTNNDKKGLTFNDDQSKPELNFLGALKEWAIICKAMEDGTQILLFRKGGIMEFRNGFELKFKNFFLFPTFEHQSKESIRIEYHGALDELDENNRSNNNDSNSIPHSNNISEITSFVEITYFNQVTDLAKLKKLENFHIWTDDYLKTRFNYNPKKPLYLLLLRVYKLNNPLKIMNKPQWVGCKSWIQIDSNDQDLTAYFGNHLPEKPFEYLKSISKPCIDDTNFNKLSEKVRSII